MSANPRETELKFFNTLIERAKEKINITELTTEESTALSEWISSEIGRLVPLMDSMNETQQKLLTNIIVTKALKKYPEATQEKVWAQIYRESLKRKEVIERVNAPSTPAVSSNQAPIYLKLPNLERQRAFLLIGLQSLGTLDENAQTVRQTQANRAYNSLLKDTQPQIKTLIENLNKENPSQELLSEAKGLLDHLNATYEFMITGARNYPQEFGLAQTKQKAFVINKEPEISLQTSTLKMAPVPPTNFSYLDRDSEGNFIGDPDQGPLQGTYSFVIMPDDPTKIRIGHGHSAISHGKDALFAGEITFAREGNQKDGRVIIKEWTNDSGHYATDASTAHHAMYAVDSKDQYLLDSHKFALRAPSQPANVMAPPQFLQTTTPQQPSLFTRVGPSFPINPIETKNPEKIEATQTQQGMPTLSQPRGGGRYFNITDQF